MSSIVLFDGVCNFCDASVNFVIEHDPDGFYRFATLQSEAGMHLAAEYGLESRVADAEEVDGSIAIDSVILIEERKAYTHSNAALRIVRRLGMPWSWLYAFIILPAPIRDFFYRQFAKYRYRFFGRKEECILPTHEVRERFL